MADDLIAIERRDAVAVLRLRAGRANALTTAVLDAIERGFDAIEATDAAAVVVTGDGTAFSAGLAIPELIDLDRAAMAAHIDRFGAVMRRDVVCSLSTLTSGDRHPSAVGCPLAPLFDGGDVGTAVG